MDFGLFSFGFEGGAGGAKKAAAAATLERSGGLFFSIVF
jgi:hypothetical protein